MIEDLSGKNLNHYELCLGWALNASPRDRAHVTSQPQAVSAQLRRGREVTGDS